MGIGVGIFLLAIGAVLAFAVNWTLAGLDLHAVGWILMAAGAIGLVLFFYFWNRRRAPVPIVRQPVLRGDPGAYRDPTAAAAPAPVVVAAPTAPPAPVVVAPAVVPPAPVVASAPVPPLPPDQRAD